MTVDGWPGAGREGEKYHLVEFLGNSHRVQLRGVVLGLHPIALALPAAERIGAHAVFEAHLRLSLAAFHRLLLDPDDLLYRAVRFPHSSSSPPPSKNGADYSQSVFISGGQTS